MKQTIENMAISIFHVETEINKGNSREAKTLMNTYRTLYTQFLEISKEEFKIIQNNQFVNPDALDMHIGLLKELEVKSGKVIQDLIEKKRYKDADNMAEVERRINKAIQDLSRLVSNNGTERPLKGYDVALIDGGASGTTIYIFNVDSGKVKFNSSHSGEKKGQMLRIMRVIDKYKPDQVIFDKRGIGEYMYERFVEDAKSAGITVKENGTVVYK